MARDESSSSNWIVRAIVVIFIWVAVATGAYYLFVRPSKEPAGVPAQAQPGAAPTVEPSGAHVEFGIAYGTEKRRWLEQAVAEFSQTAAGQRITVKLLPMGTLDSARAILDGDKRVQVWSPASSLYRDTFKQEWQIRHSGQPIAKEETLALSPLVFVMWRERYEAFVKRYAELSFASLVEAEQAEGGWGGIAEKPDWGLFKFGHTHPNKSASGLMTLVLSAYSFHRKTRELTVADVVDTKYQAWLSQLERGVSGLSDSTGNMMKEMVLKGPSAYDVLLVYEATAIDFLKNAEGRWGQLQVVYPDRNLWSDHPYYILDTEWVSADQRRAAEVFLEFLMSEPLQTRALDHGFRPGNPSVGVRHMQSPFVLYANQGLQVDLNTVCDPPAPEVINNLEQLWQRIGRGN
jgi:hypothetical protein